MHRPFVLIGYVQSRISFLSFGQVQQGEAPRLTHIRFYKSTSCLSENIITPGEWSGVKTGREIPGQDLANVQFLVSHHEVRPQNMAIKIWKRIQ